MIQTRRESHPLAAESVGRESVSGLATSGYGAVPADPSV
jgi:hypothetical protein